MQVLFGFGEKKVEQKVDQAKGAVEGAAKDAADKVCLLPLHCIKGF